MQAGDWILPPTSADAFRLQQRQGKREDRSFTEQPSERRKPRPILRGLYSRQHLRDATALPDGDMGYGREIGRPLKLVKSLTGRGVRTCDHPSASGRDKYRHVTVEKHRHSPSSTLITRQPLKKAHNAPAPQAQANAIQCPEPDPSMAPGVSLFSDAPRSTCRKIPFRAKLIPSMPNGSHQHLSLNSDRNNNKP